jgi:hypothetical protein
MFEARFAVIAIVILAIIVAIAIFVTKSTTSTPAKTVVPPPPTDGPWQCLPDINTPVRKNAMGDIQCMATNGRDCLWKANKDECVATLNQPANTINPLTCGAVHASIYGGTGYDTPTHWCAKARATLK